MPLTTFLGLLTLAPAVLGLLVLVAGLLKYPRAPLVIGLAILGALVPAVCLLFLSPALSGGDLILVQPLFGGVIGPNAWFSPAYRLDGFGMFAAYGVAFLIAPLLLWLAFHGDIPSVEGASDAQAESQDGDELAPAPAGKGLMRRALTLPQWGGVAIALGAESTALMLVFSDNVLWLALNWILLAALVWGLGEMGSDVQTMDRLGLALLLAGPVLWLVTFMLPFLVNQTPRTIYPSLAEMMGRGGTAPVYVIGLAVALALAAGAYPFLGWVRRRATLITPAGFAGLLLLALPVALFVGARSYAALQDMSNLWPQIGQARPPITAGVAMSLLGALTAGAAGLLALGRRDGRSLLALVALAQVGWGLLALGTGTPVSALALTLLLATGTLGLGAMIAAVYAGGVLLSDIEPEATGPRALGAPFRPLHLFAWTVGAATLVGAPLFAGFLPRQLASAGAVQARGLIVPLSALAWIGDGLLALALLRATAPAFARAFAPAADADEEPAAPAAPRWGLDAAGVPGAILALLALVAGIAPQALFAIGGTIAASALVQGGTAAFQLAVAPMGYTASGAQWLPSLGWIAVALVGLLLAFVLQGAAHERRSVVLSGQRVPEAEALDRGQAVGLAEAEDAWSDLAGAFASPWVSPRLATAAHEGDAEGSDVEAPSDDAGPPAGEDDTATATMSGADEPAEAVGPDGASPDVAVSAAELPETAGDEHRTSEGDEAAAVEPVAEVEPVPTAESEPAEVGEVVEHEAPTSRPGANRTPGSDYVMRPRQQRSGASHKRGGRKGGR